MRTSSAHFKSLQVGNNSNVIWSYSRLYFLQMEGSAFTMHGDIKSAASLPPVLCFCSAHGMTFHILSILIPFRCTNCEDLGCCKVDMLRKMPSFSRWIISVWILILNSNHCHSHSPSPWLRQCGTMSDGLELLVLRRKVKQLPCNAHNLWTHSFVFVKSIAPLSTQKSRQI